MENLEKQPIRSGLKRKSLVVGLLVLGLGLVFLLDNMGFIPDNTMDWLISWQMLLIVIGVINIANDSSRHVGWILIAIGGFFLLTKVADLDVNFWPVVLIVIGLILIFGAGRLFQRRHLHISKGDDFIEEVAVFGGSDKAINSSAFKGGKIVSIFGGSKIDLTRAQLAEGEAEVEIVSIFGGSTLIVPNDWNVKIEVFNIFGGYGDKRIRGPIDLNKTLIVKGVAIFGGGEIKSY
jgi:predicted membrane protein